MTEEQWEKLFVNHCWLEAETDLIIDGYRITLITFTYRDLQLAVRVYVDRKIVAKWIMDDCEIRQKFFCKHEKYMCAKKERDLSKKRGYPKKLRDMANAKFFFYTPYWTSLKAMKRHFIANCTSIEMA